MRLLLIIALITTTSSYGQVMFKKTYGSAGNDQAERVIQLYDNGYLVVGASALTGSSSDVYMLRVDSLGNYLWSRFYGGSNVDFAKDVEVTADSGFIITGFTNSSGFGGYDMYLIKTDKNGYLEWEKTYGGSDWDFAYNVQIMPDSGYVLIGETFSFGEGNNDIYLVRTDKNGNVLWEKTLGTQENDIGKDVLLTSNNQLIIAANTNGKGAGGYDIMCARLLLNGDTVWTKTYGGIGDDIVNRIKPILWYYDIVGWSENGIYGGTDILVIGIDDVGNQSYLQYIGDQEDDKANDFDIRPAVDMFIASDVLLNFDNKNDAQLLYTNYQGLLFVSHSFGEFQFGDRGMSVVRTNDDAALIAINTESYTVGLNDIMLVKTGVHPTFPVPTVVESQFQDFTDIEDTHEEVNLGVFPNPASENIQLNWPEPQAMVSIYDLSGKCIRSMQITGSEMDVSFLSPSVYILEIRGETHFGRCKLFIR